MSLFLLSTRDRREIPTPFPYLTPATFLQITYNVNGIRLHTYLLSTYSSKIRIQQYYYSRGPGKARESQCLASPRGLCTTHNQASTFTISTTKSAGRLGCFSAWALALSRWSETLASALELTVSQCAYASLKFHHSTKRTYQGLLAYLYACMRATHFTIDSCRAWLPWTSNDRSGRHSAAHRAEPLRMLPIVWHAGTWRSPSECQLGSH